MVQIFINEDQNMVKYISAIRKYDSMLSISEIKNSIQNGLPVLTKKLIDCDLYDEFVNGHDAHSKNLMFFELIKNLSDMGAELEIKYFGEAEEVIDLKALEEKIRLVKEIAEDTEKHHD